MYAGAAIKDDGRASRTDDVGRPGAGRRQRPVLLSGQVVTLAFGQR